jgi:hypothetical protein
MGRRGKLYSFFNLNATPSGKKSGTYRRRGGPQGQFRQVRKMSPTPGFDSRTVQPVASSYTDYAIPTHISCKYVDTIGLWTVNCYFA